jgi:hypothetical protein
VIAQLMISKWALQLTGALTHLSARFSSQFPAAYAGPYADELTGVRWLPWLVLGVFSLTMLMAAIAVQRLKDLR